MDKQPRIVCEISGNQHEFMTLGADTMNELVEKIIKWTTASSFDVDFYTKKGKADYLNSGWFYKKETNGT